MYFLLNLIMASLAIGFASSTAIMLPRAPKGGGGGGRGGGGGGRSGGGGGGRGGGGGGSSSSSSGGTGRPPISNFGGGNRVANYYGAGGGPRTIVPPGSVFSGREMGGGKRSEVSGTRAYGSGYPYVVAPIVAYGVVNQPFPFGFWPVYWGSYGRSYPYGGNRTVEQQRPGGEQVMVQLAPDDDAPWNVTAVNGVNETYWMVGDRESVTTVLKILTGHNSSAEYGCNVQNLGLFPFNPTDLSTAVRFQNVVQWYRASSFALAFQGYNNSYAIAPLNETANLGWSDATPLPTALQYSPFLRCINGTITAALPILDPESPAERVFSAGEIAGISMAAIIGAFFLAAGLYFLIRRHRRAQKIKSYKHQTPASYGEAPVEPNAEETRLLTPEVASDKDGNSSVAAPPYGFDEKLSTSYNPFLAPPGPSFPIPHSESKASGSGHEQGVSASSERTLVTDFRAYGRDHSS